ncbi:amidase [Saccharopolyspora sp. NPDC049357]|uniref:amidase n=1 Tax=Saccharopolyspora sp. NPDC049357 TaxID=3154507 RepID=UPI003442F92D
MTLWNPWSLRELVTDLAAGRTTPAQALERSRSRIAATDPVLRAWVEHLSEPALAEGPLRGVPLAVKDIIDVVGAPTRCGSALRADAPPATADAAIVRAWRAAGATPIGKTVTTEFAFFSPGPTRNPAAPERTPGGSSSGSAAAVASGQVPLALGSQTAGSVTRPAAFCGVASLVLGRGRFPTDGVVGLAPSLDSHGVFTATAGDLALAWSALTGTPEPPPNRAPRLLRWNASPLGVDDAMSAALEATCATLTDRGAVVTAFPEEQLIAELTEAHPVVMAYEAARERAEELAAADELSDHLATLLRTGAATTAAEYDEARRVVVEANRRLERLTESSDAIIGPAAPGPAPRGLDATGDPVMSRAWQALGLPTAAVPGPRDETGLPLGIQLIGHRNGETALLATARGLEAG